MLGHLSERGVLPMIEYLVVKDFEKFQHYKDREPPWIKLHRSLLRNYEFLQLPETAQLHLIKIWLLASQIGNKIPNDDAFIAREIGADNSELIRNKLLIIRAGFLVKLKKTGPKYRKQKEKPASTTLATCKQNAMPETEAEADIYPPIVPPLTESERNERSDATEQHGREHDDGTADCRSTSGDGASANRADASEDQKRARLPQGATIPDEWTEWARTLGGSDSEVAELAEDFVEFWSGDRTKAGRKTKRGWQQCWKNRIRDVAARRRWRAGNVGNARGSGRNSVLQDAADVAEMLQSSGPAQSYESSGQGVGEDETQRGAGWEPQGDVGNLRRRPDAISSGYSDASRPDDTGPVRLFPILARAN